MDWVTGMQRAIDYIEAHLTEEIDYNDVAAQSFSSCYHFQRVFSILSGMTVGEYIRCRRLSLAGTELAAGDAKVIDVALKYGYESPDSFAKAFYRFHGVLPSQVRTGGKSLRSFSRLVLKFSLEGGNMMDYRIEEKPEITITGLSKAFTGAPSNRYNQQHDFMVDGDTRFARYALQGMASDCSVEYGVISNIDDSGYTFTIGTVIPQFFNENLEKTIGFSNASKLKVLHIPPQKYLVVETERSAFSIQNHLDLRQQVVKEWFIKKEYQLSNAPEISVFRYDRKNKDNSYVELWLPIKKV